MAQSMMNAMKPAPAGPAGAPAAATPATGAPAGGDADTEILHQLRQADAARREILSGVRQARSSSRCPAASGSIEAHGCDAAALADLR